MVKILGGKKISIFYVYLLLCKNKKNGRESLYTGSTQDLKKRIDQHQSGRGAQYTKGKTLTLAYFETHLSRSSAMKREYEIKQLASPKKWELIKKFQSTINKREMDDEIDQELDE